MRTDTDHLAGVRDPAIERLLSHAATLTVARLLYETLERAGRAIAAAKTLLARRVADSGQSDRSGDPSLS